LTIFSYIFSGQSTPTPINEGKPNANVKDSAGPNTAAASSRSPSDANGQLKQTDGQRSDAEAKRSAQPSSETRNMDKPTSVTPTPAGSGGRKMAPSKGAGDSFDCECN